MLANNGKSQLWKKKYSNSFCNNQGTITIWRRRRRIIEGFYFLLPLLAVSILVMPHEWNSTLLQRVQFKFLKSDFFHHVNIFQVWKISALTYTHLSFFWHKVQFWSSWVRKEMLKMLQGQNSKLANRIWSKVGKFPWAQFLLVKLWDQDR